VSDFSQCDSATLEECKRLAAAWSPALQAFANPERLLIVLWLAGTEATVRDLEKVTGLKQSLVSYHLRALRDAGLVVATPAGRSNEYRLANPELNKLAEMLCEFKPPVV
jgi:DNA-binding transcriptional ArsR family regulator